MSGMAVSRHLGLRFGLSPPSANSIRSSRFDLRRESREGMSYCSHRRELLKWFIRYGDVHVLQILPAWLPRIHKLSLPGLGGPQRKDLFWIAADLDIVPCTDVNSNFLGTCLGSRMLSPEQSSPISVAVLKINYCSHPSIGTVLNS
ncbi:hypothetical protein AKJ16_DCAP22463 [Drosera capensis]